MLGTGRLRLSQGHPLTALTLAFHLGELKRYIKSLSTQEALAFLDRAVDSLYQHSEFRSVSHELFLIAIQGKLTSDKEDLIRELGIRI